MVHASLTTYSVFSLLALSCACTRQDELQLREFLGPLGESLTVYSSFCGDSGADRIRGGVAILLPRFCQAAGERVRSRAVAIVPGRVLRLTIECGPICMDIFNIHNHDLKRVQVREIVKTILEARAAAPSAPTQRLALVAGDFNFAA
eukprot:8066391-Pyramimonas_sp.AAC.1